MIIIVNICLHYITLHPQLYQHISTQCPGQT